MKILQLCHKLPYPPVDGGSMAMNNLTQGLIELGNEVKVLAINTPKQSIAIDQIPSTYKNKTALETVWVNTSVHAVHAFLNLFSSTSYNIERFYSKKVETKLIEILKNKTFDIVQLESLFVSPYMKTIRQNSKAKIILRSHNVEFKIWERLAQATANPFKKYYLYLLASRLKKYETNILDHFDGIAAITPNDAAEFRKLGCMKPLIHIPFGINMVAYSNLNVQDENFALFHIGSMDWMPNQEGITWFLENVWIPLHQMHPTLKLYLAGRNIQSWKQTVNQHLLSKNIIIIPEVEDAIGFMQHKTMMVVPLLSGGGMRVKIIEGMALGKTVISTSIGAEGIQYEDEKNLLIADSPAAFIEKINTCISNLPYCKSIGQNAKLLVEQHYNNMSICQKLTSFYQEVLN